MGFDSKNLLISGAAGGLALGAGVMCFLRHRGEEVECEDVDVAAIPTQDALKELKRTGKSKDVLAREDAYASLPMGRVAHGCLPLPGSILRERKEHAPRPNYLKKRTTRDALPAQVPIPLNPAALWRDPQRHEYMNNHLDATRWQWSCFTHVDDGEQLLSTQYVYRSPEYGVKVILIPVLRLADKQFYDSVMKTILKSKGVVLCEKLHHTSQDGVFAEMEEKFKALPRPYDELPLEKTQPQAWMRGAEGAQALMQAVGGQIICLEYLFALIESHAYWMMADKGLTDQEMSNIHTTVNAIQSYTPLCVVREVHLMRIIDDCLKAAASDEAWKEKTGQTRDGEKVLVLPWNGRHCDRIEKFLIQSRGFEPVLEETMHRILFDASQVVQMVRKANAESENDEEQAKLLPETPYPEEMPAMNPPPHNFGEHAGEEQRFGLKALAECAQSEGDDLRHLQMMAECTPDEAPLEPPAAPAAEEAAPLEAAADEAA